MCFCFFSCFLTYLSDHWSRTVVSNLGVRPPTRGRWINPRGCDMIRQDKSTEKNTSDIGKRLGITGLEYLQNLPTNNVGLVLGFATTKFVLLFHGGYSLNMLHRSLAETQCPKNTFYIVFFSPSAFIRCINISLT